MALTLKLLRLWGAPQAWTFEGDDETMLARMLSDLNEFKANAASRRAVLVAEREGRIIGTWTRDGVRRLASTIVSEPHSDEWLPVRNALEDAATGP
jgi:hypothetical protein